MGCGSSKDGAKPTTKKIGGKKGVQAGSPEKMSSAAKFGSPSKMQIKPIKEVSDAELQKHKKVTDILGFIKSGNLPMVHGLIKYHKLAQGVLLVKGLQEEFGKTDKLSMADWNPLLLAIAFKKLDIVRYLTAELKISVKEAAVKPVYSVVETEEELTENSIFGLYLAIVNKDLPMLKELWNYNPMAWEEQQLHAVVKHLIAQKWTQGLQEILKSLTTEMLFTCLSFDAQISFLQKLYSQRKAASADIQKLFDESLFRNPYLLIAVYVAITDDGENYLSKVDAKNLIEKHGQEISEVQYGHFKYQVQNFENALSQFEARTTDDPSTAAKLRDRVKALDEKLASLPAFTNQEDYDSNNDKEFIRLFIEGDVDGAKEIASSMEIRSLPYIYAQNKSSRFAELYIFNTGYYWTIALYQIYLAEAGEENIIKTLRSLLENGFNIRYALAQFSQKGYLDPAYMRAYPTLQASSLILALEKGLFGVYQYLWSEDFINLWTFAHNKLLLEIIRKTGYINLLDYHLNSPVATNHFLNLTTQQKFNFVNETYENFGRTYEVIQAFSNKFYAPYLLLVLTERDTFMKMTDFTQYNQALENTTQFELEEISKVNDYDERFLKFMRYIQMLEESNVQAVEGKKFIEMIYVLDKFKAYQNQSLGILDNESIILEEEGIEEGTRKVQTNTMPQNLVRQSVKDINLPYIWQLMDEGREDEIIDQIKRFNITDLQFFRGSPHNNELVYRLQENKIEFESAYVQQSSLNILQLAIIRNNEKLVRYILTEHRTLKAQSQFKYTDPRIILVNADNEEDETFTIRLAIQQNNSVIFSFLWEHCGSLYTEQHFNQITRFLLTLGRDERFLEIFLYSYKSYRIFNNTPFSLRKELISLIQGQNSSQLDYILQLEPYTILDQTLNDDVLLQIYNLIRDNEVDHLKEILQSQAVKGIAHMFFDFFQEDEEVLNLADDSKITVSLLNPILLAIKYKSFACLKHLVSEYGLRQSMKNLEIIVRHEIFGEFSFKNLLIPILLKIKDVEALSFLLRQDDFVMSKLDFNSFTSWALLDKWHQGLKVFLQSTTAQFYFSTLQFDEQHIYVERLVKGIAESDDAKVRKALVSGIVEETLSKKPYSKHLTLTLLEKHLPQGTESVIDLTKLARECLKSLTSEDLMQLAQSQTQLMADYERKYSEGSFQAPNSFDQELAKIVMRYANEGRSESMAPENKKQVRFN